MVQGEDFTAFHVVGHAPAADVIFRLEEQNRCSGEYQVVIPAPKRHKKVDQLVVSNNNALIERYLPAGTYFVRITQFQGLSMSGAAYTVRVTGR